MGNKRIVYADIPGGGSTADSIVMPITVDFAVANFRGTTAGSSSCPALTFSGSTITINQLAATTAASYTVRAEGH